MSIAPSKPMPTRTPDASPDRSPRPPGIARGERRIRAEFPRAAPKPVAVEQHLARSRAASIPTDSSPSDRILESTGGSPTLRSEGRLPPIGFTYREFLRISMDITVDPTSSGKNSFQPAVIIEYASGDGSEERDRTPHEGKFWIYEKAVHGGYYAIFVVETGELEVHRLEGTRYRRLAPNKRGHYRDRAPGSRARRLARVFLERDSPLAPVVRHSRQFAAHRAKNARSKNASEPRKNASEPRKNAAEPRKNAAKPRKRFDVPTTNEAGPNSSPPSFASWE